MTVEIALERGRRALLAHSGADARREALYLLAGVLSVPPGRLLLRRRRILDERGWALYLQRLARRARGEPLQYVEGRAPFRDLSLRVTPDVLIPRPETEQLLDIVLEWSRGRRDLRLLDLGTGSGAIAISALTEGPFAGAVAVDISSAALNVARWNAAEAGVSERLDFRLGAFCGALTEGERFHVIASNPPYIAQGEMESLPAEVKEWEPRVALCAGPTGREAIERIVDEAAPFFEPGGILALELDPDAAGSTLERARAHGGYTRVQVRRDLAGHERFVTAERAPY